jgi:hypothetical protein
LSSDDEEPAEMTIFSAQTGRADRIERGGWWRRALRVSRVTTSRGGVRRDR